MGAMSCMYEETIIVTRWGKTKLVGGKHKASKIQPFKLAASVQPVSGRARESLPEGFRQSYVIRLYVEKELLTSDDKKKQRADLLQFEGEMFEVIVVERNRGIGLNHFKVFAARIN